MKVLSTIRFSDDEVEKITSAAPNIQYNFTDAKDPTEIASLIADVDVLYTGKTLPEPDDAPQLAWVQMHTAGADHILDTPLFRESEVRFTTTNGMHAAPIAEYVLAMLLHFCRQVSRMVSDKDHRTWPENAWGTYQAKELRESTLGILGYGGIGREIARLAKAFGMEVLAVKRDLRHLEDTSYVFAGLGDPDGSLPDRIYPPEGLHSFLSACDYVVITAPLTGSTRGLFDSNAFAAMREGAVLINIARGAIVAETDLFEALASGHIRGAALDVFSEEPLPEDSLLWEAQNLIISPHIAGVTSHYNERAAEIFAENLKRFVDGDTLINLIDRKLGY